MFSTSSTSSKGQVGQVFIFLTAVIVIIATIFLSGRLIGKLTSTACDASLVEFTDNLQKELGANSGFGSRNQIEIKAPCDATNLCFVDSRLVQKSASGTPVTFSGSFPNINVAVKQGVGENIFLILKDGSNAQYDERVILSDPTTDPLETDFCLTPNLGTFTFHTEGYGRYIKLS